MITLFWVLFWGGLVSLSVAAGVTIHVKRKDTIASETPTVDDEVIEQIIETGAVFMDEDEPLNLEDVDYEEQRFWSDSWDEPTEEW